MIKKLIILVFLALPLGLAAQNLKFGTVNTVDVFNLMPEKATAEKSNSKTSRNNTENEFMKMQEEFTTKYKDFVNSQDSMPENIKQRRMQEIQEIQQRIQNFREVATSDLEEQQAKLLAPLQEKITNAVKAVGQENGFTFIFDMSIPSVLYAGGQAIDATPAGKKPNWDCSKTTDICGRLTRKNFFCERYADFYSRPPARTYRNFRFGLRWSHYFGEDTPSSSPV